VLGPLATASLIALDPFVQAVVSYSGDNFVSGELTAAQIGQATRLDIGITRDDASADYFFRGTGKNSTNSASAGGQLYGLRITLQRSDPDVTFSAALLNGFSNSTSAKPAPSVQCGTGNCTWAPYSSLAICSSCNDVSQSIQTYQATSSENIAGPLNDSLTVYGINNVFMGGMSDFVWNDTTAKAGTSIPDSHLIITPPPTPLRPSPLMIRIR